jgi:hypothetical protein
VTAKSTHDVVVEAMDACFKGAREERSFVAEALAAREDFERTGLAYEADDVFDYLLERASGNNPVPPTLKQWSI